ncbi:mechanosensitive ion channel family protein [[Eubacterium] cellulosolvens]
MIENFFTNLWTQLNNMAPNIIAAFIVLVIGWIAGRLVGKIVSSFFKRIGLEQTLRETVVGRAMERSRLTVIQFFDLIIRWFIYFGALLIAIDMLQIPSLTTIADSILTYLPHFIGGVFILLGGLIVSDFLGDIVETVGEEAYLAYSAVMGAAVRFFLYFIALILSLSVMKIDVFILQIIAIAIAITVAIGVGGAVAIAFGFGLREYVAKNAHLWFGPETRAKKRARKKGRPPEL